ncbi:MAG: GNAT family N-acetyltransferase [Candidatus Marinimicrobia bacterium]|jgi:RimJ/RimL family protein N-acetyltransferase|nr:GNAT family N-acetyltransferase [Candidatus Neomarinimicrobiota bacterium]MDP6610740.1 GNAT family N-acetyltransferase [Candidatus Neomarinimicrobiota bacterium]|tara:strand:+ start:9382 stop:9693 length:312 start_codon:yes stop_codon:yes gene_type:complete
MKWILDTDHLKLREIVQEVFDALYEILSDSETMFFYPATYTKSGVQEYINIERYRTIKCGLWVLILKDENKLIGDCSITIQNIDGVDEYEIGYHLIINYWGNG